MVSGTSGSHASAVITATRHPRLPKGGRMSLERRKNWYKGPPRTRENSSLWPVSGLTAICSTCFTSPVPLVVTVPSAPFWVLPPARDWYPLLSDYIEDCLLIHGLLRLAKSVMLHPGGAVHYFRRIR